MFKNAIIYRIGADWAMPEVAALEEALGQMRFVPCGASQRESAGWVEPRGEKHGALAESVGGQLILKLCVESKVLPASVVKEQVQIRVDKLKADRGIERVGAAAKKEIKEEVEQELLAKAFTKKGTTTLWLDPKSRFLVVGAGSVKKADRIIEALVNALSHVGSILLVRPLCTQTSPGVAMSTWLKEKEAPADFSTDRECELKQPDSEKSAVRYSRHTLDIDEIVQHIAQGKVPTKLAMTWNGRVSFVLTEDMSLKKLEMLDVVLQGGDGKDSGFDADVAIFTGEMSGLLPALIQALDGELVPGQAEAEAEGGEAADIGKMAIEGVRIEVSVPGEGVIATFEGRGANDAESLAEAA